MVEQKPLIDLMSRFFHVFRTMTWYEFYVYAKVRGSENAARFYGVKKLAVFIAEDDRVLTVKILRKIFNIQMNSAELDCAKKATEQDCVLAATYLADTHKIRMTIDMRWTVQPQKPRR